jgi:HK97 family phage portal protein
MNFFERFKSVFSAKDSQARSALAIQKAGQAVHTEANYEGFAKQGYAKNLVVYSAISKVATACAGVKWVLYSKNGNELKELETHPLLELLKRPNPLQSTYEFFESVVGFKFITGNAYIEANEINKVPKELWSVRPDKMRVVPNARGFVQAYEFSHGGIKRIWEVDQITLKAPIMHWKSFNPLNDWYGMSPLQAAMLALDQNNAGQKWNLALLQNSATPSGIIQMESTQGNIRGTLTDEQYAKLKLKLDDYYSGPKNAGRPMLLEGGLNWKSISLSPKDMDWVNSKEVSAIDLCVAIGVPPEIMGLGEKTYANQKEARLAFWEDTNLPTLDSLRDSLNYWLVPSFGENLFLDYDKDDIEALSYRREQKYLSLAPVKFLTINEKREAVGYDAREDGDQFESEGSSFTEPASDDVSDTEDETTNNPSDDDNENEENSEDSDSVHSEDSDTEKSWKSINLLTTNEKRKSWKRQNQKRKELSISFEKELKQDFNDLSKALQKTANGLQNSDPKVIELALMKESDEKLREFEKTIKRHTRYALEAFGFPVIKQAKELGIFKEHKANLKFDQYVEDYVKRKTAEHVSAIGSTNDKTIKRLIKEWTAEAIRAGDSLPTLSKYLEAEFEDLTPGRARTIARTEVSMASNNGALEAVKSLQVPGLYKEWVTAQDDRVRDGDKGGADHSAMNGVSVPIDEKFTVPPDADMDCPGDNGGGGDQVINCRCVLTYKQKGNA